MRTAKARLVAKCAFIQVMLISVRVPIQRKKKDPGRQVKL